MFRRGIVVAGIIVYLMITMVVLSTGGGTASRSTPDRGTLSSTGTGATSLEGRPYRSVGIQIQRIDWIPEYKKVMDRVASIGIDTVLLVFDARQENGKSNKIYLDYRMTPTVEQIGDLIDYAKKKNLRVIMMPRVLLDDPDGNEWRGNITPTDWAKWFSSYRDMMDVFSSVAQVHHADMLVIGSEMVSTERHVEEWMKTIDGIRANFKGRLTYSSNWDHYDSVPFWDQLDMIGMNSYWTMSKHEGAANVSVEEVQQRWGEIQSELLPFMRKHRKPLLFLEVGWFSQANAAMEPWDYTKPSEPIDLELQKKLYEAFFRSWWGNPALGGFSIWEWPPNTGGPEDKGYNPEGKPALEVLKEWLKKGPWEVK